MKTFAVLSAAALIGMGALTTSPAEARGGGALAAGLIGGLAAGALLGAVVSEAHAGPAYGYAQPDYGYAPAPHRYVYEAPAYETRRISYEREPVGYGYAPAPRRWHRDCDRPDRDDRGYREDRHFGYGGW
ncbi:hypothetical protein [Methylobacterium sp. BTF04]|uniref:hypothetical protein n=1 Tax=Methylobacterium sp. BTF04 TaxID=2708300 RepID=UPI001FEE8E0B|nr:hypothetical protein [Methylobacterium sp. BTF04]